jgi:hypothetical protein
LLSLAREAARLGCRAREEGRSSDQRRACTREGRRESSVRGLDAPVRGRVGGSRSSGASARLREGGWEGRRESATTSASGGAPARGSHGGSLAAAATAKNPKIRDRVVWLGRWG